MVYYEGWMSSPIYFQFLFVPETTLFPFPKINYIFKELVLILLHKLQIIFAGCNFIEMFHLTKLVLWHLKWNSFFIWNEISLNVQMKTFSLFVDDKIQMFISNLLVFFCDGNKLILSVAVAFDLAQRQFCFCITHSPRALFWLWFILGLSGSWHLAYCFCWCEPFLCVGLKNCHFLRLCE